MPIEQGCTHCGSDQHNTTDCPMREAFEAVRDCAGLDYFDGAYWLRAIPEVPDEKAPINADWELWQQATAWQRAQSAAGVPGWHRLVSTDWLKQVHRDLDACQKLIWANLRGCDPAYCADAQARLAEIDAMLAASPAPEVQQGEFGDAYQGAREDLAIWKRRALEAEEAVRQKDQIIDRLVLEAQGETNMGEPVVRQAERQKSAPDADQLALDTATDIMALMYGPTPAGGSAQLKAQIQCRVLDAINAAPPPAKADMPDHPGTAWIDEHADTFERLLVGRATEGDQMIIANHLQECDIYEDVYAQLCDLIEPHVERPYQAGWLPGSVVDSMRLLLEKAQSSAQHHSGGVTELVEALEQIVQQYPNPDINHVDYRVHACRHAETALAAYRAQQDEGERT